MIFFMSAAVTALLAYLASPVTGLVHYGRDLDAPLLDSYDYVVVGCGISGLVTSMRLSEDPSVNVLCIEAGLADHDEDVIRIPVFVGDDIGGIYDWDLSTVPQNQLDGNTRPMPQGKAVGGGSILNAMCWNRGGQDDYDAWEALGNPGWGWNDLLPYFMKSENYTFDVPDDIAEAYSINYNPDVHGFDGPVHVSYPKYFYPQSINFFAALNLLGVPTEFDQAEGTTAGAAFVPTDLMPDNQTRSDARRTYYDPYSTRPNYHVITGQHVTQLLFEGYTDDAQTTGPTTGGNINGDGTATTDTEGLGFGASGAATPTTIASDRKIKRKSTPTDSGFSAIRVLGVEFASNATAPRQRIYATREVIVAAGSLHSTQLMELSGVGPAELLEEFNIAVVIDLPGVGNNLQDHCLVGTFYPYNNASYPSPTELTSNSTYDELCQVQYFADKTGPWTAGSPNGLAFPPLPLISKNTQAILSNASSVLPDTYLLPGLDPTVIAGYTAQRESVIQRLGLTTSAAYEILNNNAGSLTVSVMHPLSRGVCYINSVDPFEPPLIDPRWLSDPTDRNVLLEALKFNRQILATPPMLELQAAQFVPPIDADEAALNQVINNGIRTEFHPSGTLAMLPLEKGGVVDPTLLVYGTTNLRVVDASIFPLIPAAHLQAVVYAVAEKAADIIKAAQVETKPSSVPCKSLQAPTTTLVASTQLVNPCTIWYCAAPTTSSSSTSASSLVPSASQGLSAAFSLTLSGNGYNASTSSLRTKASMFQPITVEPLVLSTAAVSSAAFLTTGDPLTIPIDAAESSSVAAAATSSVIAVLTSAGVPPPLASSFAPAIIPTVTSTWGNEIASGQPGNEQSILAAFIQWLISFFHLST